MCLREEGEKGERRKELQGIINFKEQFLKQCEQYDETFLVLLTVASLQNVYI